MCYIILGGTMHFNLYIDDFTGSELEALAHKSGQSRNAIIRQAISDWIARQGQPQWPPSILKFKGIPGMSSFEESRTDLTPPSEDPFA